jgi:hypothetical protein
LKYYFYIDLSHTVVNVTSADQEIAPGIILEWRYEQQIAIFVFRTASRPSIDRWFEVTDIIMRDWDSSRPFLVLYDTSGVPLTPYIREKSRKLAENHPHLKGRTAVRVEKTFMARIVQFFLERELKRKQHARQRRLFFALDEALDWLKEALETPS